MTNDAIQMRTERDAWERLITLKVLSVDSEFAEWRAQNGFYSAQLKAALSGHAETMHGPPQHARGDVGKVTAPPTKTVVESVADLRRDRTPTEWIISEFGAKGAAVILASESGVGKTSFMYRAAEAVALGEPLMGQLPTLRQRVLFIQADESRRNAADKLQLMGMEASFDFVFPDEAGWNGLDLQRLASMIEQGRYGAIFLDSITTLLTGGPHSMRDVEFADPLYELNRMASDKGLLCVLSAHLRKPEGGSRSRVNLHDILGITSQVGAVSDVWGMWNPPNPTSGESTVLGCLGKRNCEQGTTWLLQGDPEDFSWTLLAVGDSGLLPSKRQELSSQILSLLGSEYPLSSADISKRLRANAEHVRRLCAVLYLTNKLARSRPIKGTGRPAHLYGPIVE